MYPTTMGLRIQAHIRYSICGFDPGGVFGYTARRRNTLTTTQHKAIRKLEAAKRHIDKAIKSVEENPSSINAGHEAIWTAADLLTGTTSGALYALRTP
jgi:hypothetical protein